MTAGGGLVGIVTKRPVRRSRVRIPVWVRDLSFLQNFQTALGLHPASYTMFTVSAPRVKRPKSGTDHPSPSSALVEERVNLYISLAVGLWFV